MREPYRGGPGVRRFRVDLAYAKALARWDGDLDHPAVRAARMRVQVSIGFRLPPLPDAPTVAAREAEVRAQMRAYGFAGAMNRSERRHRSRIIAERETHELRMLFDTSDA